MLAKAELATSEEEIQRQAQQLEEQAKLVRVCQAEATRAKAQTHTQKTELQALLATAEAAAVAQAEKAEAAHARAAKAEAECMQAKAALDAAETRAEQAKLGDTEAAILRKIDADRIVQASVVPDAVYTQNTKKKQWTPKQQQKYLVASLGAGARPNDMQQPCST